MDPRRLQRMARISALAYGDGAVPEGFTLARVSAGAMQAIVLTGATEAVLAFRGTDPSQAGDWDADLRANYDAAFGGRVHQGFKDGLVALWPKVSPLLPLDRPLAVTGHSLGGALATLGALQALGEGAGVASVITFGSPAVGDQAFVASFTKRLGDRSDRVVHFADPVPRLLHPGLGFFHVPTLRYLDREGRLVDDAGWAQRSLDRVQGWFRKPGAALAAGVPDHLISSYINALEQLP
ncbi:MAG TPA: lipase family protein [Holophagaceae bacterium]|nr:lipase family protein [Holophagaceae bacterium]